MLIVTEAAEAAECVRLGQMEPQYEFKWTSRSGSSAPEIRLAESGPTRWEVRINGDWTDGAPQSKWVPLTRDVGLRLGYDVHPIGLPSELADIIIRTLDMAASLDIDMDAAMIEKMGYNMTRPERHGGKSK